VMDHHRPEPSAGIGPDLVASIGESSRPGRIGMGVAPPGAFPGQREIFRGFLGGITGIGGISCANAIQVLVHTVFFGRFFARRKRRLLFLGF